MKHSQWMTDSARGIFTPRSKGLKAVDAALAAYDKAPSPRLLDALSAAIEDWTASKADWKQSVRADSMNKLMRFVSAQKGLAINTAAANFAIRRQQMGPQGEWLVSIDAQQTLTYPSPGYDAYCNQYFGGNHSPVFPMKVNFGIVRYGTVFVVNVRALGEWADTSSRHVPGKRILQEWKTHCESAWNCAVVYVGQRKYDLQFNLIWVTPEDGGPYYTVKIHQPPPPAAAPSGAVPRPAQLAKAAASRADTPHLALWGGDDRQAILHEFGHMIGNPDEYLCTAFAGLAAAYDGSLYNKPAFSVPSIMNNTAENGLRIYERHFAMVRQEIVKMLEHLGPKPVPNVRIAIERPAGVPSATEFILSQAMHQRRRMLTGGDDDW